MKRYIRFDATSARGKLADFRVRKEQAVADKKSQVDSLLPQIAKLKPRIEELIETARDAVAVGITPEVYPHTYGADSFGKGSMGFIDRPRHLTFQTDYSKINYIFCNYKYDGGHGYYSTDWYFYTNGSNSGFYSSTNGYGCGEKDVHDTEWEAVGIQAFLDHFDAFESAFYDYIEQKTAE